MRLPSTAKGAQRLSEELGIEPGQALRALELAILRQDPALDAAAVPGARLPGDGGAGGEVDAAGASGDGATGAPTHSAPGGGALAARRRRAGRAVAGALFAAAAIAVTAATWERGGGEPPVRAAPPEAWR